MGVFSKVTTASVNGGGVYFLTGSYKVSISAVKSIVSRSGDNLFVIECDILESDVPERRPNTKCSQVINLSKHESAPGNIKAFMAAALDESSDNITENECELAVSDQNPLEGTIMRLVCTTTKTKRNTDFTLHQWSFIAPPDKAGQVAAAPPPAPAFAPPAPPAAPRVPAGFQPHPSSPGWYWNPQTNEVKQF
jgi:hypothetical protein